MTRRYVQTNHRAVAARLRANPQKWEKVATFRALYVAKTTAQSIRTGSCTAYLPPGAFEARIEQDDDGSAVIARYVGNDDEGESES